MYRACSILGNNFKKSSHRSVNMQRRARGGEEDANRQAAHYRRLETDYDESAMGQNVVTEHMHFISSVLKRHGGRTALYVALWHQCRIMSCHRRSETN